MEKLIGIEEVNNIINEFLSKFGCTAKFDSDFGYYYHTSEIGWSVIISETSNDTFSKFVKDNFSGVDCDIFLWSLLHELGHHETINNWTNEEQEKFDKRKEELENKDIYENYATSCETYYYIPDEYEATKWAYEYMINNEEEVSNFWDKLQGELISFYLKNMIELDDNVVLFD